MWAHDDFDIGHWNDRGCDNRMPYICKTRASLDVDEPPSVPKCDGRYGDFDKFTDSCYKKVSDSFSWTEAEERCQQLEDSHLVSILKESENAFTMVAGQSELVWTGLSNRKVS